MGAWKSEGPRPCNVLTEWENIQVPCYTDDRLQIVPDPVDPANNVLRAHAQNRDVAVNSEGAPIPGGWRAEVVGGDDDNSHPHVRYRWRTLFDHSYPAVDGEEIWQVVAQWHQGDQDQGSSPPVAFGVDDDMLCLDIHDVTGQRMRHHLVDLNRGHWHELTVDVWWTTVQAEGWVELRHPDLSAVRRFDNVQTLFPRQEDSSGEPLPGEPSVYFKMGIYRKSVCHPEDTFVVYHDDFERQVIGRQQPPVAPR